MTAAEHADWERRWRAALAELHARLFDEGGNPRDDYFEHVDCPVCGADRPQLMFRKDDFAYHRCADCGMVYMNPRLNTAATLAFYNSEANEVYNETKFHAAEPGASPDDAINQRNVSVLQDAVAELGASSRGKPLRLLEVGCAKGFFLERAREVGFDVEGVELNEVTCRLARERLGDVVYDQDILELDLPAASYDVVYTRDVIEHIATPGPFFAEVARILKPGGLFFAETHNIESLVNRLAGKRHTVIFGFEHPVHWSPATLTRALARHGLTVERTHFDSRDLRIPTLLQYFRRASFTTIREWRASRITETLIRAVSLPFRLPGVRHFDRPLVALANAAGAGSTMKVIAVKTAAEDPRRSEEAAQASPEMSGGSR